MTSIDLNADMGESFGRWALGDDATLCQLVTSANIACGFHAGDPTTLRRTCADAIAHGVRIGAQVGYRDLAGFGRRFIDVSPTDLAADVLYQLGALEALARVNGGRVSYVKPHGALYHAVTDDDSQARAVVDAVHDYDPRLTVLGFPGSALLTIAEERGLPTATEFFADRRYANGRLVDRREPDAVLHDSGAIADAALDAAERGLAASICLHGDTPGAVGHARAVRDRLERAEITIAPFS